MPAGLRGHKWHAPPMRPAVEADCINALVGAHEMQRHIHAAWRQRQLNAVPRRRLLRLSEALREALREARRVTRVPRH